MRERAASAAYKVPQEIIPTMSTGSNQGLDISCDQLANDGTFLSYAEFAAGLWLGAAVVYVTDGKFGMHL